MRKLNINTLISIVVPVYNESGVVEIFIARIISILENIDHKYEIIFINDGSTDDTFAELEKVYKAHKNIRVITFSRNFGKEAAISAGIDYSHGDALIPIDIDLQDPPELIINFIKFWQDGYDVVYGIRKDRSLDSVGKRITSRLFYAVFNKISKTKIPYNVGDYRLIDRKVIDIIKILPERNRFMKGLFSWVGFKSIGIPYKRPERISGETKWSYWKLWNFSIDGITSFSTAPLKVWMYIGGVISSISFCYALLLIIKVSISGVGVPGYTSTLVAILFLGGLQLLVLGIYGEYLGRIYEESKSRPIYILDSILDENKKK
jgi:glycosyltransferase involved in cell wall biosynthesis